MDLMYELDIIIYMYSHMLRQEYLSTYIDSYAIIFMAIELYILVELSYIIELSTYILLSHEMFIKIFMFYMVEYLIGFIGR